MVLVTTQMISYDIAIFYELLWLICLIVLRSHVSNFSMSVFQVKWFNLAVSKSCKAFCNYRTRDGYYHLLPFNFFWVTTGYRRLSRFFHSKAWYKWGTEQTVFCITVPLAEKAFFPLRVSGRGVQYSKAKQAIINIGQVWYFLHALVARFIDVFASQMWQVHAGTYSRESTLRMFCHCCSLVNGTFAKRVLTVC